MDNAFFGSSTALFFHLKYDLRTKLPECKYSVTSERGYFDTDKKVLYCGSQI